MCVVLSVVSCVRCRSPARPRVHVVSAFCVAPLALFSNRPYGRVSGLDRIVADTKPDLLPKLPENSTDAFNMLGGYCHDECMRFINAVVLGIASIPIRDSAESVGGEIADAHPSGHECCDGVYVKEALFFWCACLQRFTQHQWKLVK